MRNFFENLLPEGQSLDDAAHLARVCISQTTKAGAWKSRNDASAACWFDCGCDLDTQASAKDAVTNAMSFVPFFYAALRDGSSPSPNKAAEHVVAGHKLAEAVQAGLSPKLAHDETMREAVACSFLEAATRESARALFHLAKYLAAKGEFLGAGQLLEAQSRTDSSLTLAKARRQARTDAMRATKAIGTHKWKTAVRTAGERLRKAERGWPITDLELARQIRKSKEVAALPKHLIPGESTVRAVIREFHLGAKARRQAIREENQSRRKALRKAPGLRRVASADC